MRETKAETPLDEVNQAALRETVRNIISGERISTVSAAKEADVANLNFNAWVVGSYAGDSGQPADNCRLYCAG